MKIKANYIALACDQYTACHILVMMYQGSVESDNIKLTITDVLSNDVGMVALELYPVIDDEKEVYTVRMRLRGVEETKNFPYTQMNVMLNNRLIAFWMTEIDKCVESMKGLN